MIVNVTYDREEIERIYMATKGKFCKCKIPYPGMFFCRNCNRFFRSVWDEQIESQLFGGKK